MQTTPQTEIIYPDSDGQPMAENTIQYDAITSLKGNLDILFADREDVFIAADLFWYPVEGRPDIRTAPDVLVAFGRPKGHRRSYMQWQEGGIAPQVVFEVLSDSNTPAEMDAKRAFYAQYGVEEYYVYDPETGMWAGWLRSSVSGQLEPIAEMEGWVSPRLGIRFGRGVGERVGLRYPDGSPFLGFMEIVGRWREASERAYAERLRAEQARRRAEQERLRAEQERLRAERLAEKLRQLGIEPDENF